MIISGCSKLSSRRINEDSAVHTAGIEYSFLLLITCRGGDRSTKAGQVGQNPRSAVGNDCSIG